MLCNISSCLRYHVDALVQRRALRFTEYVLSVRPIRYDLCSVNIEGNKYITVIELDISHKTALWAFNRLKLLTEKSTNILGLKCVYWGSW